MSKTLHIYRGVPGSGKSTEAEKYSSTDKALRINRDDIRRSIFGRYWGMDEQAVTKFFEAALETAMATGKDVISDNTNLVARHVRRQMELAQNHGYTVEFHDFPISLNEAIERDSNREKQVGEKVIRSFFTRFIGRDGLSLPPVPTIQPTPTFVPVRPVPSGKSCIIVDIDGTLAHHEGVRGPYETSKYHLDAPDDTIATLAEVWTQDSIPMFIMSGRDADYRNVTEAWLQDNLGWRKGHEYKDLYMRPSGDNRNDAVVKNELFEQHIAGKFNVDFVLDDRDRVVKMWRAKGLKVLQVADGNF